MTSKILFSLAALSLFVSCTHKSVSETSSASPPSTQRCIAGSGAICRGSLEEIRLDEPQTSIKDNLVALLNEPSNWPKVTAQIDALLPQIEKLSAEGKLQPVLMVVAKKALDMGKLPPRLTAENLAENIELLSSSIENQFIAKGRSQKHPVKYISLLKASQQIRDAARKSSLPPAKTGDPSLLTNPEFIRELEVVAGSQFKRSQNVRLLVDGPQSFAAREKLIKEAKKSIYIKTWAMEDDVTGWTFAKMLLEKHKAGVDVRVIVDNKTARQGIYGKVPTWLEQQGVPTIRWKDPSAPMYAFHKKMLITDNENVLGGGMNFGDAYSHMGPEATPKWRDTDFMATGNAAVDAAVNFKNEWNSQVDKNQLSLSKINEVPTAPSSGRSRNDDPLIMVVDQVPNPQVKDQILTSIIKAIEGATKEINIENAYFIESPPMQQSLLRALKRGVKVNILTNSMSSIDVPIIAKPILDALPIFLRNGANIYLKKGATLHSKFMTVDGVASWVMSYNHHPQSMRIQGEDAFVILDTGFTSTLANQFVKDTQTIAEHITDVKALEPPRTILDVVLQRYFFDQL